MDFTAVAYVIFIAYALHLCRGYSTTEEAKLRNDLLGSYDIQVRPNGTTKISLSLQPTSIKVVDIRNQELSLSGWWSMRWTDDRLTWTPSSYDSIPILQIKQDYMWTPTLVVDNSVDDLTAIDEDTIPLRVHNSGTVTWNPPALLTVTCEMDITYFPFDKQTCAVQVTSFGYTIEELDIYVYGDGVVLSYFQQNGEWDILDNWNERTTFSEDNYQYAKVFFYFYMERKPLYYGLNMLLPVIINAFLTIFVFILPAESGEKIGYCLTVLLAFMVILTLIATDLPTTAKYTSMLELYIAIVLIMGGLSVIFSIFVLEVYFRSDEKPIPDFVRDLTLLGMRICCYDGCCNKKVEPERGQGTYQHNGTDGRQNSAQTLSTDDHRNSNRRLSVRLIDVLAAEDPTHQNHNGVATKQQFNRKHSELGLRPPTAQSTPEEQSRGGEITWQTVSIVMDGILLRLYALTFLICSIVFLAILISG